MQPIAKQNFENRHCYVPTMPGNVRYTVKCEWHCFTSLVSRREVKKVVLHFSVTPRDQWFKTSAREVMDHTRRGLVGLLTAVCNIEVQRVLYIQCFVLQY